MIDRKAIKLAAKQSLQGKWLIACAVYLVYTLLTGIFSFFNIGVSNNATLSMILSIINLAWVLLVMLPISVSVSGYYLDISRNKSPDFKSAFMGFKSWSPYISAMLWYTLWIFVWSLIVLAGMLLFPLFYGAGIWFVGIIVILASYVPAFIKSIAYCFVPFIIRDYPDFGARKALKISLAVTKGRKKEIFVFALSFILWYIVPMLLMCGSIGVFAALIISDPTRVGVATGVLIVGLIAGMLGMVAVAPYCTTAFAGLYDRLMKLASDSGAIEGFEGRLASADAAPAADASNPITGFAEDQNNFDA